MPTVFSEILKSLTGPRDAVQPSADIFPLIDLDQVALALRLEARGNEDGGLDQPAIGDGSETSAESDVRAEIQKRAWKAQRDYRHQLDLYNGRIQRALVGADLRASIEAAGQRALSNLPVQVTDDLSHLDALQLEVKGRHEEFEAFRRENGLARLPRRPGHEIVRWMVVAILVCLETILNGFFFAKGSQAGIIGGVAQALVLSGFNVAIAIAFARYGLPYLNHHSPVMKSWGLVALSAYVACAATLNLAVGHYRDLYVQHEGNVPLAALAAGLVAAPLGLADTESLVLVALGLCFSLVAVIDVYGMDDPYPGFGAVGRRKDQATQVYGLRRTMCLKDLEQQRDEAIDEMLEVIENLRSAEHEVQLSVSGRTRLHQQYVAYLEHLRTCYIRLVERYREANKRSRRSPPPLRFGISPASPELLNAAADLPDLSIDPTALRQVIDKMESFIREIRQTYDLVTSRYPPIMELRALTGGKRSHA